MVKIAVAVNIFLIAMGIFNIAFLTCSQCRQHVILFFINASYGCWPWSPKVVEYKPGMTLCPGQTAVAHIEEATND